MSTIFANDFDSVADRTDQAPGWYAWTDLSKEPQLDTTVSHGGLPGKCCRLDYDNAPVPINPDGGTGAIATGAIRYRIPDMNAGEILYLRWYWRTSTNFDIVPGGSGSKIMYIGSYAYGSAYPAINNGVSNHRIRVSMYNPTASSSTGPWGNKKVGRLQFDVEDNETPENVGSTNLTSDGTWQCIEFYFKFNTTGVSNGEVSWWIDDVLQGQYTGVDLRGSDPGFSPTPSAAFNTISIDGYFGGAETNVHPAQSTYYDDVVAATTKIGPTGGGTVANAIILRPVTMM